MRLEFVIFIGVFCNLMLMSIFPSLLLPSSTANVLLGEDTINYDTSNNGYFSTKQQTSSNNLYGTLTDEESINDLTNTESNEVTILDTISNFFDGLFDSLSKIALYISFIVPFSAVFYLLPGALGLIVGGLYSIITVIAIVRFIRG